MKYWEKIAKELQADGWQVRWTEAMHDREVGWTVIVTRGEQRRSIHANDLTLAFQELEETYLSKSNPREVPPASGEADGVVEV